MVDDEHYGKLDSSKVGEILSKYRMVGIERSEDKRKVVSIKHERREPQSG